MWRRAPGNPYVAMQKIICCYANKWIAAGIWYAYTAPRSNRGDGCTQKKGDDMSKTASIEFARSNSLFGRLMASIDRLLTISARISARNGDLPYFGL
jgi:hypothetical protein